MSVADGIVGFEETMRPRAAGTGILRLLAPWREYHRDWPADAVALDAVAVAVPSFDRRAAAVALHDVLAHWRAIGRELDALPLGNLDRALLEAQAEALRGAHGRLFGAISRG